MCIKRLVVKCANLKFEYIALAGVAQWFECQSMNQRVTGSIPSQGIMPGLWARFPVGGA